MGGKFDLKTNKLRRLLHLDPNGTKISNLPVVNKKLSLDELSTIFAKYLAILNEADRRRNWATYSTTQFFDHNKNREIICELEKIAKQYLLPIQYILKAKDKLLDKSWDKKGFSLFGRKTPDPIVKLRSLFSTITVESNPDDVIKAFNEATKITAQRGLSFLLDESVKNLLDEIESDFDTARNLEDAQVKKLYSLSQDATSLMSTIPTELVDVVTTYVQGKK